MKFGLMLTFQNPARWHQPDTELYQEYLRQIVRAEELGYEHVWVAEHHFDTDGWTPSVLPLLAGIATRTQRIRIGTSILILPLHNALRVAEDAATVDILSNGRLDLGIGKGYRINEFAGFGIPREKREALLEEGLEVIRRAWTEESFSFDGTFYHLKDVRLSPRPVQRPHPPLWIGARGKKAADRAARLGFHLMGTGEAEQQRMYDQALVSYGRDPREFSVWQTQWTHLAPTRDQAWDDAEEHLHHLLSTALPLLKAAGDLRSDQSIALPPNPKDLRTIDSTLAGVPIVGTPEDCIRALERYQQSMRITHLGLVMHLPGLAPAKVLRSMELFAREVMPHFQGK